MDKTQAQNLVRTTFENPFDKNQFINFIKNLLNSYDNSKAFKEPLSGIYIKEHFRNFISKFDRIGRYSVKENEVIDILIVYLQKNTSIERARTAQRNFIAGYLKGDYGSKSIKDAALVAFVSPDEEDWRFSFVKMDFNFKENEKGKTQVVEELSPARRWSFLVGKNETSHTAQKQLVKIIENDEANPSLSELEEAFNIEKVTKEFFEKYRELFLRTKEELDEIVEKDNKLKNDFNDKGINTVDFSKKLLGQIVFLYFLQKKGWFGVDKNGIWGSGPKNFLRELFKRKHGEYKNFFNDILEPLFYEALAKKRDNDFYKTFNCRIPFLNGGLFDPINNYDWEKTEILLPNSLFSNNNKTKEGDTGDGILDIFERYNFTVKEDEPLEKEVAVDPEMLGKVFENLLEVKDRKSKGTYYTPREIVHYMSHESLRNCLKENFENIDCLFETSDDKCKFSFDELQEIKNYITTINICDPACGSGAFILGMMNEMIHLILKIDRLAKNQTVKEVKNKKNTEEVLFIKKGDIINYNPDDELLIKCKYIGDCRFAIEIKGQLRGELLSQDMALYIKAFINNFNKNRGKKTVANIFSQGKINDGKSFNSLRREKKIRYISDDNKNIIWMYKDYETDGKTRYWQNEDDLNEEKEFENILAIEDNYNLYLYVLKKKIIQNCLYGVDIDPGAVEIAKLRLWLSLSVEFEGEEIEPLPNLDYKIMQGNSLIEEYEGIKLLDEHIISIKPETDRLEILEFENKYKFLELEKIGLQNKNKLTNQLEKEYNKKLKNIEKQINDIKKEQKKQNNDKKDENNLFQSEAELKSERLKALHKEFFNACDKSAKDRIKKEIEKLIKEVITITLKEQGKEKAIIELELFEKTNMRSYFLWKLHFNEVFHEKGGFDVVIGNPPYVSNKDTTDSEKRAFKIIYGFSDDLYNYFYLKGLQILKSKGILSYITSDTFLTIESKLNLRLLFQENKIIELIKTENVFEIPMVEPAIIIIKKEDTKNIDYNFIFKDAIKDFNNSLIYETNIDIFRNSSNKIFFPPSILNMQIYKNYQETINNLLDKWWDKIKTSKDIVKNKIELKKYRESLKPGDVTLLGLITEGGVGLQTGNNGKYIAVLSDTKFAENIKASRPLKFFDVIKEYKIKKFEYIKNKDDAIKYNNTLKEKEIWSLFDSIKEKYGRDVLGQGYLYKIIDKDETVEADLLTDDEMNNGINNKKAHFVLYDKGDRDGNKWYLESPYYIEWNKENVKSLKNDPKARWQGYDYFFKDGFCWTNVLNPNASLIKCRLKDKSINDVGSMSLYPIINIINSKYLISIINSYLIFHYLRKFINNTVNLQLNDFRQFPIIIPTKNQLKNYELLFEEALTIKVKQFKFQISIKESEQALSIIQEKLDKLVYELYNIKID